MCVCTKFICTHIDLPPPHPHAHTVHSDKLHTHTMTATPTPNTHTCSNGHSPSPHPTQWHSTHTITNTVCHTVSLFLTLSLSLFHTHTHSHTHTHTLSHTHTNTHTHTHTLTHTHTDTHTHRPHLMSPKLYVWRLALVATQQNGQISSTAWFQHDGRRPVKHPLVLLQMVERLREKLHQQVQDGRGKRQDAGVGAIVMGQLVHLPGDLNKHNKALTQFSIWVSGYTFGGTWTSTTKF